MDTDVLIERLATDTKPVRCLRCPLWRSAIWLAFAAPYIALAVLIATPRRDLAAATGDDAFLAEQAAALAAALAAAYAAFTLTIPGSGRRVLLLPAVAFLGWVGILAAGSADEWLLHGAASLSLRGDWLCVRWIVALGAVPAAIMAVMLSHGAPMAPWRSAALGGLAAAALGNFGLRLILSESVGILMLAWHAGTLIAFSLLAGWIGRKFLCWRVATAALRRSFAV